MRRMSRKRAMILELANKALSGNVQAAAFFFPKASELNSAEIELDEQTRKLEEQHKHQLRVLRVMTPEKRKLLRDLLQEAEATVRKAGTLTDEIKQ